MIAFSGKKRRRGIDNKTGTDGGIQVYAWCRFFYSNFGTITIPPLHSLPL